MRSNKVVSSFSLAVAVTILLGTALRFYPFFESYKFRSFDAYFRNGWISSSNFGPIFNSTVASALLHLSIFIIFILSISLFLFGKNLSARNYATISLIPLCIFLLRPFLSVFVNFLYWNTSGYSIRVWLPSHLRAYLIGDPEISWQYFGINSYSLGIFLLILLIVMALAGFKFVENPSIASKKARKNQEGLQPLMQQHGFQQKPNTFIASRDSVSTSPNSVAGELERLQNLYKSGALTDDEYIAAKQRIINS